MTIVACIRHGVTDWNIAGKAQGWSDIPLNEQGREQARRLAERLAGESWDAIISSDLGRARETAEIIASRLNLPDPVVLEPELREMNCGLIEGTTEEERVARWGKEWWKSDLGREQPAQVMARGERIIRQLADAYQGKRVLAVSHGGLIGYALKRLIPHVPTEEKLHNTSVTLLRFRQEGIDCDLFNCAAHLEV
ncbi:histidine phosphatase family protein [Xylanibacillus composti]|uniref:Histidine phosphatase family protein n=1 Tax=Xylanibacillus composti TaxID=1572762 RepID=A0A8J4GZX5_9BACL|nr:histidine phosphatase family protein [Xylanibacillus composti]MDT9724206.1 histidine phosphatase family protein [Xylanibacillus composti]GIQ68279.1 hypothetical protein XYCOK13_11030 [Xylanibacillus composti]